MNMKEKVEEVKVKANEAKEKIVDGAKKVGKACDEYFTEHPGVLFKVATIGGGVLLGVLSGAVDMNSPKNTKCQVEDDVTGCKYLTKHPLTNSEILELSGRMKDGETHGEALNDMGLLRKEKRRR